MSTREWRSKLRTRLLRAGDRRITDSCEERMRDALNPIREGANFHIDRFEWIQLGALDVVVVVRARGHVWKVGNGLGMVAPRPVRAARRRAQAAIADLPPHGTTITVLVTRTRHALPRAVRAMAAAYVLEQESRRRRPNVG